MWLETKIFLKLMAQYTTYNSVFNVDWTHESITKIKGHPPSIRQINIEILTADTGASVAESTKHKKIMTFWKPIFLVFVHLLNFDNL